MAGKSNPERTARPWLTVVLMVVALVIGLWLPGRISVTGSESLGHRVFFLVRAKSPFKQGDYLLFRKQLEHSATDKLLKIVGCAPGERLTVKGSDYFCGQRFLGRALDRDSQGGKLERFIFNGVIPKGSLFMIGRHERSYDSRYFGFIHAENVLNKAYPLW